MFGILQQIRISDDKIWAMLRMYAVAQIKLHAANQDSISYMIEEGGGGALLEFLGFRVASSEG